MKTNAILYSAFALLAIACTKENLVENTENNNQNSEVEYTSLELYATIEGSKTELGKDGEVKWLNGDAISIFDTATGTNTKFTTTGDGWFTSETGVPKSDTYYALYYYRSAASWKSDVGDGVSAMQSKLFPDQIAKVGSFGNNVPYMAGKVDTKTKRIEFKNICSHIGFTLSEKLANEGVKSLTLMGNNSEKLCGTMQISIDNDGNPSVNVIDPDIYVRLHNNGKNLVAGTYYFSIVPQTFSNGFTVIVSKADGSQVAVKTENEITEVAKRNVILPMSVPPADRYKPHKNYFVQYLDGFPVEIGGQTINSLCKNACLISTADNNLTIGKDSIYFVHPGVTAQINYTNVTKNLVVIGADADATSTLTVAKSIGADVGCQNILMKNLNINISSRMQQASSSVTSIGTIAIVDSKINSSIYASNGVNLIRLNNKNTTNAIILENNDIYLSYGDNSTKVAYFLVNFGDAADSKLGKFEVKNNIIYSRASEIPDFRLINGFKTDTNTGSITGLEISNCNVSNNTFCNVTCKPGGSFGLIKVKSITDKATVEKNYLIETNSTNSQAFLINLTSIGSNCSGIISNNYSYSSGEYNKAYKFDTAIIKKDGTALSGVQNPRNMTGSPLNSNWDPAKGIYGPYNQVTYGTGTDTVPTSVGAQRPDMVTEANTASYRYAPNELGSF